MNSEQIGNVPLDKSSKDRLNIEIEELEPIIAPGNTWSV